MSAATADESGADVRTVRMVRHNRVELALHTLRAGNEGRTLLLLHGLGEASPASVPEWADGWPGDVVALDFTGHGDSTVPAGGGYTAELLLGDADVALGAIVGDDPDATVAVHGRGLGAYIALMLAGARATQVRGAILSDGPGLAGGPTGPSSQSFFRLASTGGSPDPYALVELGRDLRPPDYATSFVRLAVAGSPLDEPIAVCSVFRPEWLEAVAHEHGVMDVPLVEAVAAYS